ncbi:hypothetical protein SAMN05216489_03268 [Streptomyces sp. 3213]|uniref:hypothetical protein n=1 Tax=Streptomyces sp. 3213.3 TaxID=1855348 RepID=UPI000899CC19|nr:hypothetical protein [Streptomyces sp. 3213.3]SED36932.1 hypothetical protein SAMN05216489_03268 [Streptomyces sp. 3213] [Streptomyces sp. 3213.3]
MRTVSVLLRHELRLLVSLWLWITRRTHGADGGRAFGYGRGQGAMMAGLVFVCLIETLGMSVLLRNLPAVHRVVLALDVYTIVFVVGMHAAFTVRPHVLAANSLRIRRGVHVDLRIPLDQVASVRRELRMTHERADGELNLPIGSRTTVTLQLTEPVAHFTFLGRQQKVSTVRFHADDADTLVAAVKQARTAPSTSPGPPA